MSPQELGESLAARAAGGKADDRQARFSNESDPAYRAVLEAIVAGKAALEAQPRMDMPGAVPVPQARDFGRTF